MHVSNGNGHEPCNGHGYENSLGSFSPELQRELKSMGTAAILEAGSILFTEGQPLQSVAFVATGRLKLTRCSVHGKTLLIRISEGNEILGLSSALQRMPHITSVEALERARVLLFDAGDFLQRMRRYPELALFTVHGLSSAYHSVIEEASRLALSTTVASRIAHLLLELNARNGNVRHERATFTISLRHEDIAFMAGTSRESVTRTLSDFRRRRILSIEGPTVTILQRQQLEQML